MFIDILKNKFEQKCRTSKFPKEKIILPDNYRGLPVISDTCPDQLVALCSDNCPTGAIDRNASTIDLGACVFCGDCERLSEGRFVSFTGNYELGATSRQDLVIGKAGNKPEINSEKSIKKIFGRSLQLRVVSAGGCNACEADVNVLNTPFFDLSRFGIQFAASPRHSDGLLILGPVTENMALALQKTYDAVPDPKVVIASGCCAVSGGIFRDNPEQKNGVASILDVDLYIPGCPPHPLTVLDALLKFFKR